MTGDAGPRAHNAPMLLDLRSRALVLASLLGAAPLAQDAAPAPTGERLAAALRTELDALHADNDFPGLSLAVVLPDGASVALAVGHDPFDPERALTPEQLLLSGSVGKMYVAAMALQLAGEGVLDLDAPLQPHFAADAWYERLPNADALTARALLRHQSGLRRYVFDAAFWEELRAAPDRIWEPAELLAYVFDSDPLFEVGVGWAYADTNYILLGMLLERLAEQPFYDYVQERFLEPHALEHTRPTNSRDVPGMAQGQIVLGRQFGLGERVLGEDGRFTYNPQFEWCGGGWANTPADLARFGWLLWSGRLLGEESLAEMLETVEAPMLGPGRGYGLGVISTPTEHGSAYGHDGFMPGYMTSIAYLPEHDVSIALMLNRDNGVSVRLPLPEVWKSLLDVVVEELDSSR